MAKYLIIIEKASSNYAAYSPDLPGCVAAGDSIEEVETAMREAIEMHIRGLREDNLPVPEPRTRVGYVEVEETPVKQS